MVIPLAVSVCAECLYPWHATTRVPASGNPEETLQEGLLAASKIEGKMISLDKGEPRTYTRYVMGMLLEPAPSAQEVLTSCSSAG